MPLSPESCKIVITDNDKHDDFKWTKLKKMDLPVKFDVEKSKNIVTKSFIRLLEQFALVHGYAPANKLYISDDEMFVIKYLDTITDRDTGEELTTPMRIGVNTQVIEVSAKRIRSMTIPMVVAIGLHEFAHLFKNDTPESEIEADMQSLFIFLSLGYPRVEAKYAWLDVFDKSTPQGEKVKSGHKKGWR